MTKNVSRETKFLPPFKNKSKPVIQLFLDISSKNSGVVIYREDIQEVLLDSINLQKLLKPTSMSIVDFEKVKIGCIKNYLDDLKKEYEICQVYLEGIFIQPKFLRSSQILLKIHGFIAGYFIDTKVNYLTPSEIKKNITGKGNSNKDEVKAKIEERYRYLFKNNDESDAFALLISQKGWRNYIIKERNKGGL